MDTESWLKQHQLEKHLKSFLDNDISFDLLVDLNDKDLAELGLNIGDRKRFARAISITPESPTQTVDTKTEEDSGLQRTAQRRQLTVMFVDLVGSTELSLSLDPEDMSNILSDYQALVGSSIGRHSGYVSRYMGDGVLIYFGWPTASEDDAVNAVRAALEITAGVSELQTFDGRSLACRCGIATGLVVVGKLIGEGPSREHAVIGETPNLAARLQSLAEPNQTVISDGTRRLAGRLFDLQQLDNQQLKGISDPVSAYIVRGTKSVESRYQAIRHGPSTPMVGRAAPLARLHQCWQQANVGESVHALLQGEAGIGKSRLLHGFINALGDDLNNRIILQCEAQRADSALYPVREFVSRLCGIVAEDTDSIQLNKVHRVLADHPVFIWNQTTQNIQPLITRLLGIADDRDQLALAQYNANEIRSLTLHAISCLLRSLANTESGNPLLLVLEDAHWIDPTTTALLRLIAAENTTTLLLITARPEFRLETLDLPDLLHIELKRLDRQSCAEIVHSVAGDIQLPENILNEIVSKTDGIPLFAEELTKTVIETNARNFNGGDEVVAHPDLLIPSSLHDSLMARLDRLQPVREVAQTAACLGRDFNREILEKVLSHPTAEITSALQTLIEADLIHPSDHNHYAFKHALVRDAAYESLLKRKRRLLHLQIAEVLETHFNALISVQPELAAYHFRHAESYRRAADYWLAATKLTLQRVANQEAIAHAGNGLECLELDHSQQEDSTNTQSIRYELLFSRGMGYMATHGYAADVVSHNFNAALEIALAMNDTERYSQAARGVVTAHIVSSRFDVGLQLAESMLERAETPMHHFFARRMQGQIYLWQARFNDARRSFELALDLYDPDYKSPLSQWDDGVLCIGFLGITLTCLGQTDRAEALHRQSVQMAQSLNQPFSHCQAMESWITSIVLRGDDFSEPLKQFSELADKHQMVFFQACAQMYKGIHKIRNGELQTGVDLAAQGLELYEACQSRLGVPKWMTYVAEGYFLANQPDRALQLLHRAREAMDTLGNDYFRAEWLRVRAELYAQQKTSNAHTDAREHFEQSISLCRSQNAKLFELTSSMSLAKHWLRTEQRTTARALLKPIIESFGEETPFSHLHEARELLTSAESVLVKPSY